MKTGQKTGIGGLVLLTFAVSYLLLWPVAIEPVAWEPPEPPELVGPYAVNERLKEAKRFPLDGARGPEDVAVDQFGHIYVGVEDGRILRFDPDGTSQETFVDTGGRPLGLEFGSQGQLFVADAYKGLLQISPTGTIATLATGHDDQPFKLTDDVTVSRDGIVYFTDASKKFALHDSVMDVLEHGPNGRVLAYDPATNETTLLGEGLRFANGVALSDDEQFLLVAETGRYRLHRYWLEGPRRGQWEIFKDNLPGFPDGVSQGDGIFWVALASTRKAVVDAMLSRPFIRKVVARLPASLLPAPDDYGFVLGLDNNAEVVYNLQDPAGHFAQITSVQYHEDKLFLGSLSEPAFAVFGSKAIPGTD